MLRRCRYVLGITPYSDLTLAEFKSKHLMPYKRREPANFTASHSASARVAAAQPKAASKASASLPKCNVDWRKPALNRLRLNVITPVKDQGECGAEPTPTTQCGLDPTVLL